MHSLREDYKRKLKITIFKKYEFYNSSSAINSLYIDLIKFMIKDILF